MSDLTALAATLDDAKAARKAIVTEHGTKSEQAREARKAIDRAYQALKRAQAKATVEPQPVVEDEPSLGDLIADETVEHVAKRTLLTDADVKVGIYARRKVRATGHVVERIDGKLNPLGVEGGRWIVHVVATDSISRYDTRKAANVAARKA